MQDSSKFRAKLTSSTVLEKIGAPAPAKFKIAGLFAGIAGFELGFRQKGHSAALLCDSDSAARRVLAHHFPEAELASDVRDLANVNQCDVITAGFPCQDLSQVGRTKGIEGSESGLVNEVFRLLKGVTDRTKWLVLENVPFMLRLQDGSAIKYVTQTLDALGWNWAYRSIDTRSFGLPQRRLRVFIVASRTLDPRMPLFSDDAGPQTLATRTDAPRGFYWTEGHRGLGRAFDAVPPLKGGSGLSIPSPPAVWFPSRETVVTPSIEAAERLQGFPARWSEAANAEANGARRRWRLVGNAVSVPIAAWLADQLSSPQNYDDSRDEVFSPSEKWPMAASRIDGRLTKARVSDWPVLAKAQSLATFLGRETVPLSLRAAAGFLGRLEHSSLRHDEAFVSGIRKYVMTMRETTISAKPPQSDSVSRRMAKTLSKDNAAEKALRSSLHKKGYRFRVHYRAIPGSRRTVDIAFPVLRVAIFVDGCFWHGCPVHGTWPKYNGDWWRNKIEENKNRDRDTDERLKKLGWTVARVWEHENSDVVERRLSHLLKVKKERLLRLEQKKRA